MCLPCLPDSSSSTLPKDPVLHLAVNDDAQPDAATAQPLQFNALQVPSELDTALVAISSELDSSIEQGTVSFAPQLAVMNIPTEEPDDSPPASVPSTKQDLENPMVVADYSAHGEQVNC